VPPEEVREELGLSRSKLASVVHRLEDAGLVQVTGDGVLRARPGDVGERIERAVQAEQDREHFDRSRVEMVRAYAEHDGCRRAFLLGYFGDEVHRCGGDAVPCDSCAARGDEAPVSDEDHLLVRKVLSCVARVNGAFGRKRIALCLTGSDAREVVDGGLHRISTFGALRGKPVSWVLDVLGTLEAAGLLMAEGDEYPCLRITAAGREVMHDRARLMSALPDERSSARSSKKARRAFERRAPGDAPRNAPGDAVDPQPDDEPLDEPLYQKLRELRARFAAEEKLPAYCVFHDRTLAALARQRPATLDQLATVPGVGPSKLAKYGAAFLAALRSGGGGQIAEPLP
jgi:ATP-dependent DNA helicase RecQ